MLFLLKIWIYQILKYYIWNNKFQLNISYVNDHTMQYICFLFRHTSKQQICINNDAVWNTTCKSKMTVRPCFHKMIKMGLCQQYIITFCCRYYLTLSMMQQTEHVYWIRKLFPSKYNHSIVLRLFALWTIFKYEQKTTLTM